ncbi:MAG: hypothetical protein ACI9G1_003095, partial [Pirellulaceae bacterium]
MTFSHIRSLILATLLVAAAGSLFAQKKQQGVWTDPNDETIPSVFVVQGEYEGKIDGGGRVGSQVIALDEEGSVQAVVYLDGLPGAGWDEKSKILLDGKLSEGKVELHGADTERKYMDGDPKQFSATRQFPPTGHKLWTGAIEGDVFSGQTDDGTSFVMKKKQRQSPTLGAKPPQDAVLLFDGTSLDHWNGGRLDEAAGVLHTDAKDVRSKNSFKAYTVHIEFRTPFRPKARGQGRGNSGF